MAGVDLGIWQQLNQLEQLIINSPRLPFSDIRLVNEGKIINLLNTIRDNLPVELAEATQLIKQKNIFITQVQSQAKLLIQKACQERYQLIQTSSVLRETELELAKLRERTHEQCEKLLQSTRNRVLESRREYEMVTAYIYYIYSIRYSELDDRYNKLRHRLYQSYHYSREQCLGELEKIRSIGARLQKNSQIELERLHDGVLRFRQKNQFQCEAVVNQLRRDAMLINEEVNNYTEKALDELEIRIKEMNKTILIGRSEILKLRKNESLIVKDDNPGYGYFQSSSNRDQSKWSLKNLWRS